MSQPSLQDLETPFDPTGSVSISGAGLQQFGTGLLPYISTGLVIYTDDIGGNPEVPDAVTNTKWQRYLWIRRGVATATLYLWNPGTASDATYLKWQTVASASLAPGSVTNPILAPLAVTDDKVLSISWSKITGAPVALPPSGAAGGDLTGAYPNPSIDNNKVNSAKLSSDAAVDANRAVGSDHIKNNAVVITRHILPSATDKQLIRVNVGHTALEYFTNLLTQLAEPTVAEELKFIRVKADASGFEYVTASQITAAGATATLFTSAEFGLASGVVADTAHALGALPSYIRWVLRCKTGELGYGVGDEVSLAGIDNDSTTGTNYTSGADATKVFLLCDKANPKIMRRDTGANANITAANWKAVCYARL